MRTQTDTDNLAWNCSLTIGGDPRPTRVPRWADVVRLDTAQRFVARRPAHRRVERVLRKALAPLMETATDRELAAGASYIELTAAMAALDLYYTTWLNRVKEAEARRVMADAGIDLEQQGPGVRGPGSASKAQPQARAGGFDALRPFLATAPPAPSAPGAEGGA